MRYLILSDIHANLEALQAALARAQGQYDTILCLGDVVGYGADPGAACDWVRENTATVIRGNHDKACAGLDDLEWFNDVAKMSAQWTQGALSPENLTWLRELPKGPALIDNFQIVHGSPVDEDEYLLQLQEARQIAEYLERPLCFFGHTHVQGGFELRRRGGVRIPPTPANDPWMEYHLEPDSYYLINPGSIGQPRDADPRAAFCIYNSSERLVAYHRVAYDVASAQNKIRAAGLPDLLARRLSLGQ